MRLVKGKKTQKRQSEFQKLWEKAERLKKENARFQERLDKLVHRIETEIRPIEMEAAKRQIPLLRNLLILGQRKSLTKWQRRELHDWIQELLEPLIAISAIDTELREDLARYEAFRLGIELDESSSKTCADQLREELEAEEEALSISDKEDLYEEVREEAERILDNRFGPEPPKPEKNSGEDADLFQDEFNETLEREYNDYHERRNKAREELIAQMLSDFEFEDDTDEDEDDDYFDFDDFNPFGSNSASPDESDNKAPVISNAVFKRLFRSTAGQLHPDRESDPELRDEKHALMSRLLEARKHGDVMTIVEMYQKYVADDASLSKSDEKALIATLKQQIDRLAREKEAYSFQSPLHHFAFDTFYFPNQRKTDQAFKQHIQEMEKIIAEAESQSQEIRTLKTLKPYLEERYDDHRFLDPFAAFGGMFGSRR